MDLFIRLIGLMLPQVSPIVKDTMRETLQAWEVKAAETDNPWDDMFVNFLRSVIGV